MTKIHSTDNVFERADYLLHWQDGAPIIEVIGQESLSTGDPRDDGRWVNIAGRYPLGEFARRVKQSQFLLNWEELQKLAKEHGFSSFLEEEDDA